MSGGSRLGLRVRVSFAGVMVRDGLCIFLEQNWVHLVRIVKLPICWSAGFLGGFGIGLGVFDGWAPGKGRICGGGESAWAGGSVRGGLTLYEKSSSRLRRASVGLGR